MAEGCNSIGERVGAPSRQRPRLRSPIASWLLSCHAQLIRCTASAAWTSSGRLFADRLALQHHHASPHAVCPMQPVWLTPARRRRHCHTLSASSATPSRTHLACCTWRALVPSRYLPGHPAVPVRPAAALTVVCAASRDGARDSLASDPGPTSTPLLACRPASIVAALWICAAVHVTGQLRAGQGTRTPCVQQVQLCGTAKVLRGAGGAAKVLVRLTADYYIGPPRSGHRVSCFYDQVQTQSYTLRWGRATAIRWGRGRRAAHSKARPALARHGPTPPAGSASRTHLYSASLPERLQAGLQLAATTRGAAR